MQAQPQYQQYQAYPQTQYIQPQMPQIVNQNQPKTGLPTEKVKDPVSGGINEVVDGGIVEVVDGGIEEVVDGGIEEVDPDVDPLKHN